jgi:hypothetical protein
VALALATLPFFAYDLGSLAGAPAPDAVAVEADLARRVEAGPARPEGQFAGYLAGQMASPARYPWLGRNTSAQAAYYLAVERGLWSLPLPSTGLVEGTDP